MNAEPKTQRGRDSRNRIIESAAALIADRGVGRVGVDDVVVTAGVGKGQLYHYFNDRDALVEAAVARRCEQVQQALRQMFGELNSLSELEHALGAFVGIFEQTASGCPVGTIAMEVAGRNPGAQLQVEHAFDEWEALFARLFERLQQVGQLRPDADPADLATVLLAALQGGQILSQTRGDSASLRIAIAGAVAHIRQFARSD